jgi:hypothetical protein
VVASERAVRQAVAAGEQALQRSLDLRKPLTVRAYTKLRKRLARF